MTLILASTSAIRRQMLDAAGLKYRAEKPDVDEGTVKTRHADPQELASELAALKACSFPGDGWVIGSDSVLSVEGRLFDKPVDREQAAEHLRFFSGKQLTLTSAVALARGNKVDWSCIDQATLRVRLLSERFIESYLHAEWPQVGYCVGAFRLEGRGVQLFERIDGDYFTILGMPLLPLLGALRVRGAISE